LTVELAVANGELRRQYEEKEALSERLSLLLKALPAGVVVLDSAARVSEANPAASEMFAQAMIGESWPRWHRPGWLRPRRRTSGSLARAAWRLPRVLWIPPAGEFC
jgi:PAS domain-containing protein